MAQQPCPKTGGKHKWTFIKNFGRSAITRDARGSRGTFSVNALYQCECGATRTGAVNVKAPGFDLRDHFPVV